MPQTNLLEDVANDLALWIDSVSTDIALAFSATRSPFSARVTEQEKLDFYRTRLFNPDGSPNAQGRQEELERLGTDGFAAVYKAVVKANPQLAPPPQQEIEVPQEWPQPPPGPGAAPGGLPGPPGGPPLPPGGPPMPLPRPMASGGIVTEPTLALIGEAGPEMVVPLADYQYQQPSYFTGTPDQAPQPPAYTAPKPGDIEAYIRQAAQQRGINPDIATRVAYFEGGRDLVNNPNQAPFTDPAIKYQDAAGASWWPYQLHYGGPGYEQYGKTQGMGTAFTEQTGYQPGDPAAWQPSVDYALDQALKSGWTPWYGAGPKGANVSQWQGIPRR